MTRMMKILCIAGLSSVYLMQGACQMTGDGLSIIPTIQDPFRNLFTGLRL